MLQKLDMGTVDEVAHYPLDKHPQMPYNIKVIKLNA